jgi:hypothetical protein
MALHDEAIKALLARGLSFSQIALELGLTRSTVGSRVQRMRAAGLLLARRPPAKLVFVRPLKIVPDKLPAPPGAVPLIELGALACHWPVGGSGRDTLLCNAARSGHPSYCQQHAVRSIVIGVWQPSGLPTRSPRRRGQRAMPVTRCRALSRSSD